MALFREMCLIKLNKTLSHSKTYKMSQRCGTMAECLQGMPKALSLTTSIQCECLCMHVHMHMHASTCVC